MAIPEARYPDLDNAVVVITGGADGIGRAIAEAFHAQGARVGILDHSATAITQIRGVLPGLAAKRWICVISRHQAGFVAVGRRDWNTTDPDQQCRA